MWTDLPRFRLHACPVRKSFPLLLYHDKLHQDQLNAAPLLSCSTIAQRCNARTAPEGTYCVHSKTLKAHLAALLLLALTDMPLPVAALQ